MRTFILWLAAYLALRLLAPHVSVGSPFVGAVVAAITFMLVSLALIVAAARMDLTRNQRAIIANIAFAIWIAALVFKLNRINAIGVFSDAALIVCATHFGVLLSSVVREPKLLLPVALCAGLVDIWGVNVGGPVKIIAEKNRPMLEKATAQVPAFGSARIPKGRRPPPPILIGFGDFFFLGVFFACMVRFGMNVGASFWLTGLCTVSALIVLPLVTFDLPGLPFMAVGVILPNVRHFRFSREEKFALLYAGLLLASLLTGAFIVSARIR